MKKQQRRMVMVACLVSGLWAGSAQAQDRLIQAATDPRSGAAVRVYQGRSGAVRVDVDGREVQVRRTFGGGRASTTVRGGGEEIRLEYDGRSISLSGTQGRLTADGRQPERLQEIRDRLTQSPLVRRAAAFVGTLGFGAQAPVQPVLLTTRLFLQTMAGEQPQLDELRRWLQQARNRVRVTPVAFEEDGPTECWETYAKEAIAAYMEYEECMAQCRWWDLISQTGCATVYEMRAIGAFAWWVKCVGLKG